MSLTSFTSKQLRFTLILSPDNANSVFPGTNSNTLVLSGLRAMANIQTVPGIPTRACVKLFGMKQQDMNALTVVFFNALQKIVYNNIIIEQNSGRGWTQVFSGMIVDAQPRYGSQPNVFFEIQAMTGYQHQIAPVPPISFRGTVPVDTIVSQLAGTMGYAYSNDGVDANVTNCYLPGTNMDQLSRVCQMSRTQYVIAGDTLAIYPIGKSRPSVPLYQLSPQSGLELYPELEKFGIIITALYNPALTAGGHVQVTGSKTPNANGLWAPFVVDHELESNNPSGRWHSVAQCTPVPT